MVLKKLLGIGKHSATKKIPTYTVIDEPDTTASLDVDMATKYRSAIGILIYLIPDFIY